MVCTNNYLVICNDYFAFNNRFNDVLSLDNFDFGFDSTGDAVRIYNFDSVLTDSVFYSNTPPWPG